MGLKYLVEVPGGYWKKYKRLSYNITQFLIKELKSNTNLEARFVGFKYSGSARNKLVIGSYNVVDKMFTNFDFDIWLNCLPKKWTKANISKKIQEFEKPSNLEAIWKSLGVIVEGEKFKKTFLKQVKSFDKRIDKINLDAKHEHSNRVLFCDANGVVIFNVDFILTSIFMKSINDEFVNQVKRENNDFSLQELKKLNDDFKKIKQNIKPEKLEEIKEKLRIKKEHNSENKPNKRTDSLLLEAINEVLPYSS